MIKRCFKVKRRFSYSYQGWSILKFGAWSLVLGGGMLSACNNVSSSAGGQLSGFSWHDEDKAKRSLQAYMELKQQCASADETYDADLDRHISKYKQMNKRGGFSYPLVNVVLKYHQPDETLAACRKMALFYKIFEPATTDELLAKTQEFVASSLSFEEEDAAVDQEAASDDNSPSTATSLAELATSHMSYSGDQIVTKQTLVDLTRAASHVLDAMIDLELGIKSFLAVKKAFFHRYDARYKGAVVLRMGGAIVSGIEVGLAGGMIMQHIDDKNLSKLILAVHAELVGAEQLMNEIKLRTLAVSYHATKHPEDYQFDPSQAGVSAGESNQSTHPTVLEMEARKRHSYYHRNHTILRKARVYALLEQAIKNRLRYVVAKQMPSYLKDLDRLLGSGDAQGSSPPVATNLEQLTSVASGSDDWQTDVIGAVVGFTQADQESGEDDTADEQVSSKDAEIDLKIIEELADDGDDVFTESSD